MFNFEKLKLISYNIALYSKGFIKTKYILCNIDIPVGCKVIISSILIY